MGHDPERIGIESVETAILVAFLPVAQAGHVSGDVERRLGQELEEDARVHGRVARIAEGVLDGIRLRHAQECRLLGGQAE
jgi:hypothetical protein